MQRKALAVLGIATVALLMTGCAKKADNGGGESVGGEVGTISVAAMDGDGEFSFAVDDEGVSGGIVNIDLNNEGEAAHDFQLIEATTGHTIEDVTSSIAEENAPFEEWIVPAGGTGSTAPGESTSATVTLPAGTYWYFCTESSEVAGEDVSHATSGMAGELTVEGDNAAALPETDATITASEYTFVSEGLAAGKQSVRFENDGEFSHHVLVVPIVDGTPFENVEAFLTGNDDGGVPPIDFEAASASAVIGPGRSLVMDFDFEAATNYALLCFLPDPGTSEPPHAVKGMLVEASIA